jgi:hypothetical protein
MNHFIGLLSPGLLLRSLFSGVFFVIAFVVAHSGKDALALPGAIDSFATALGISLIAGVIVYTIHRSVIYALIESLINSTRAHRIREHVPLIGRNTIQVLLTQWKNSSKKDEGLLKRAEHFSTWADYAHLQYTSAICIWLGSWFGTVLGQKETELYCPLAILSVFFFIAALVADWRLHAVREHPLCDEIRVA